MYASTISFSQAIRRFPSVLHLQQEHWHIDCVPHLVCSRAIENVTNKPVTMGGHRDKIDIFLAGKLNDFIGRFTKCEHGSAAETLCSQFTFSSFQVCPVFLHLFTLSELELIKVACHPAVGDVDKK